jgi:GNAT superfamily N-acetyltransferase
LETKIERLVTIDQQSAVEIAELAQQLGYENHLAELTARLHQILKSDQDRIFVAIYQGKIIGWIHAISCIRVESQVFVEIAALVVDQHFRKQQLGKQLIQSVIGWANHLGIKTIKVRCNVVRKESHRFYEALGFSLKKEQKVFELNHSSTAKINL